ncbi:hypothetical protein ACFCYC_13710, partial [Streptomyces sp. NPDC056402]
LFVCGFFFFFFSGFCGVGGVFAYLLCFGGGGARARARALPALPLLLLLLLLLLAPIGPLLAPEAIDRPATAPYGRDVLSRLLSGGAAKALGISAGP